MQISESHCGPAVIQMLLSNAGVDVTQEAVAAAGGASSLIAMNGMRVDQLARAVSRLAPGLVFYYKDHATMDELVRIVVDYRTPVGVEWQGLFEDEDEENGAAEEAAAEEAGPQVDGDPGGQPPASGSLLPEDSESEDEDYGHYSLVVRAYRRRRELMIADPYKDYFSQARVFSFDWFESRWYDYNERPDPVTGQPVLVEDYHMLFMVAPRSVLFPRRMGMRVF
jgi:hypothetical protein